jgi:hypothetical protein
MNRGAALLLRLRAGGHDTTAAGSGADNRRRRGGRSPRSGLGRAGSASRQSMRPSRRTDTSTARPSLLRGPGTVDIRSTTVRCRRWWPHVRTGVDLWSALGGDSLLASRSSSDRIRINVVPSRELSADHLAKWPTCAVVITRVNERHHRVEGATSRTSCTTRPRRPRSRCCCDRAVPLGGLPPDPVPGNRGQHPRLVDLVAEQRCMMCAPASCLPAPSGIVWRSLVAPVSRYPWSVLWRAGDSEHISALVDAARALFERLDWRNPLGQLIPILRVLSAPVMSRALIHPFPTPP